MRCVWKFELNLPMKRKLILPILLAASLPAVADAFRFADVNDKSLGLWEGDKPVLVYNHGVITSTNAPADRARSSYVHPIYGLDGEVITDDFPRDHYHHRGLFWSWPHVKSGTNEVDLWMLKGIRHEFDRWLKREASETAAVLGVQNHWLIGNRKAVREEVWLRALPANADGRAIDVELIWTPLGEPLTLRGAEDKSYGGLTLRYAPHKTPPIITVPDGRTKEDLTVTRLPWADFSAEFRGATSPSGAAIFISPTHPDFPPEWLTRHYGVLCVGWPGVKEQTFQPDAPIRCRYRVWVHRGAATPEKLREAYHNYAGAFSSRPLRDEPVSRPKPR